jgi:Fe-S cluster assembly scaffold protein SufB
MTQKTVKFDPEFEETKKVISRAYIKLFRYECDDEILVEVYKDAMQIRDSKNFTNIVRILYSSFEKPEDIEKWIKKLKIPEKHKEEIIRIAKEKFQRFHPW